jgi:endoglycosylceramidase
MSRVLASRSPARPSLRALACAAACALLLAAGACSDRAAPLDAGPPLASDGTWVRDRESRVVLLRGLNYSGLEFGNLVGRPRGPEEADFAQMAGFGINAIRLPIAWAYVEPAPNAYDDAYLADNVDPIVDWAARHGLWVVLDMHQYLWSPCTGGNGVPAWTCEGRGYPATLDGAYRAQTDFWAGALAPDGRRLVDHLLDVWERVARRYAGSETVVALDLFNEPGDRAHQATFERDSLYPFYREAIARIRAAGATQLIALEPPITRNIGVRARPEPVGDENLIFAPHLYTTTFGLPNLKYTGDREAVTRDYAQTVAEAAEQGGVPWIGEYGGITDVAGGYLDATERFLADSLAEQDRLLIGSAWWAYFPSDNGFSIVDADGVPKGRLADILTRPWARRIGGVPIAMAFDAAAASFELRYADNAQRPASGPTEVFVPPAWIASVLAVETNDGAAFEVDAARGLLLVERGAARGEHVIRVRPRDAAR